MMKLIHRIYGLLLLACILPNASQLMAQQTREQLSSESRIPGEGGERTCQSCKSGSYLVDIAPSYDYSPSPDSISPGQCILSLNATFPFPPSGSWEESGKFWRCRPVVKRLVLRFEDGIPPEFTVLGYNGDHYWDIVSPNTVQIFPNASGEISDTLVFPFEPGDLFPEVAEIRGGGLCIVADIGIEDKFDQVTLEMDWILRSAFNSGAGGGLDGGLSHGGRPAVALGGSFQLYKGLRWEVRGAFSRPAPVITLDGGFKDPDVRDQYASGLADAIGRQYQLETGLGYRWTKRRWAVDLTLTAGLSRTTFPGDGIALVDTAGTSYPAVEWELPAVAFQYRTGVRVQRQLNQYLGVFAGASYQAPIGAGTAIRVKDPTKAFSPFGFDYEAFENLPFEVLPLAEGSILLQTGLVFYLPSNCP